MRRRAALWVVAILLMLFVTAGSTLALIVHHVPAFYLRNAVPEGPDRRDRCQEFLGRSSTFWNSLAGDQSTEHQFTEQQFNSYFQE